MNIVRQKVPLTIVLLVGIGVVVFAYFFVKKVYHVALDISYQQQALKAEAQGALKK